MGRRANIDRLQAVYAFIREHPGSSPKWIGKSLGIKHNTIYHLLPRLERPGLYVYEDNYGNLHAFEKGNQLCQ